MRCRTGGGYGKDWMGSPGGGRKNCIYWEGLDGVTGRSGGGSEGLDGVTEWHAASNVNTGKSWKRLRGHAAGTAHASKNWKRLRGVRSCKYCQGLGAAPGGGAQALQILSIIHTADRDAIPVDVAHILPDRAVAHLWWFCHIYAY